MAQSTITDTGKGIKPQFLPHVLEYFRQEDGSTTHRFGGLGRGLAIVRQIVELHGGTVSAESLGEDQGDTFTVQLPTMLPTATITAAPTRSDTWLTEAPLSGIHVLVVDDDTDARKFQAFLLEQSGAIVTAVASGAEALHLVDRLRPQVLLSDIGMADMDGYTLMQHIRALPPEQGGQIPAIALTAYAGEFDQRQALQAGFQQHLAKPIEPGSLINAIAALMVGTA